MLLDGNIDIDAITEAFAATLRHPLEPELMIWADPPRREPGTWVFRKGQEPERIAETSGFEGIWMRTIGITEASVKEFAE